MCLRCSLSLSLSLSQRLHQKCSCGQGYAEENVYYGPNASNVKAYGFPQRMCPSGVHDLGCHAGCSASATIPPKHYMGKSWSTEYNNDIFVFDTLHSTWGRAVGTSTAEPALMPPRCGEPHRVSALPTKPPKPQHRSCWQGRFR